MARCFGSARANTGCARPSASSTGCSTRRSVSTSQIDRSHRTDRGACRAGAHLLRRAQGAGLRGVEVLKPFEIGYFLARGRMHSRCRARASPGDLGYELWMGPARRRPVWDSAHGSRPHARHSRHRLAGLNIARIEAGFLLPNVDFVSAEHTIRTGRDRSPLELGLAWLVDFKKGHFTAGARCWRSMPQGRAGSWSGWTSRQQAGAQCAAVHRRKRQARNRQCHLRDLVAHLQAQHRSCYGRCPALPDGFDGLGGYLLEP
jgi:hypothetical protein